MDTTWVRYQKMAWLSSWNCNQFCRLKLACWQSKIPVSQNISLMWCSLPRERDTSGKDEYHCLRAMEKASEALQPLWQKTLVAAHYPGPKSVPRPKFVENKWRGAAWKHNSPHTGKAAITLSQLLLIVENFWI